MKLTERLWLRYLLWGARSNIKRADAKIERWKRYRARMEGHATVFTKALEETQDAKPNPRKIP